MTITILQGDCRERMRELADGSVHCVVTSPPYWSLRDYSLPPSVWGGDGCKHEWGETIVPKAQSNWDTFDDYRDGRSKTTTGDQNKGGTDSKATSQGQFCRLCNAWRGCLGLEPTPDCGRPLVELREDLTDQEREYVLSELRAYGLIDINQPASEGQP